MSAILEELRRSLHWQERHRRLFARLGLVLITSIIVAAAGSVATYFFERHAHQTQIKTFGDAVFFTIVQLLTVSSQIQNPLTAAGRVVDVVLEVWAVVVVAGSAGAIATFFQSAD